MPARVVRLDTVRGRARPASSPYPRRRASSAIDCTPELRAECEAWDLFLATVVDAYCLRDPESVSDMAHAYHDLRYRRFLAVRRS